ncbi:MULTISPECIES: sensor histidine kinase [unclassified Streptomyces]|uniref:sensor histidine kinase n=1 Tax=unclassified Streptomyces TaxID=2593676 RepID=UPI00093F154A|nr:histidine kinase [Streptomyces sp. CB02058]OKI98509.1 histidine kinase [Streptomyces sp. CB02058]
MRRPWPGRLPREAWTTDIGVTLLVQAAITMPFVVPRSASLPPATWAAYGLTTLTVLPLAVRRRAPVSVLIAVLSAGALYRFTVDGPGQPLPYTGLVAFYTVAELSSPRRRLAVSLLVTAAVVPSVAVNTGEARELLFSLFVFAAAYAFGRFTHTRKAYIRAMEDRARQREVTHRIEAEQAAARERARIAREMHDILSHAVSLMIVQAEAGPVAVRTAPERAEAAFDAISETGRDAMVQLRRMLGVLREDAPGDGAPPRTPQPALSGLPGLLDRVRSGGLDVTHTVTGRPVALPADTEATVYRIVQEALTNVVRHAGASRVTVELGHTPDRLTVTVTDDGRGPGTATGLGLVGIRERAAAHGGTAGHGAGPDGTGFQVRVALPL